MAEHSGRSRRIATTLGLMALAGATIPAGPTGPAAASVSALSAAVPQVKPSPKASSLSAAKQQLKQLNDQVDQLANSYNKAKTDLQAAQGRLKALNKSLQAERKNFEQHRIKVAQIASTAYKNGDTTTSIPALVSAKDPRTVLDQMSAFAQISHNRANEVAQFLAAAQRVEREQALAQQAAQQLQQRKSQLDKQKGQADAAIKKQLKLIAKLGGNIDPGSSKENCSILATGKAEKVLRFACAQLGKPYVLGGAGPRTWDCSGLTMVAYRQVGIKLNHWVPDQYDASRRVSKSELQPGDLVFFHDNGHEGMYVGQGKFIHAPHTGDVVKISNLSDAWYTSTWVGGGRLL